MPIPYQCRLGSTEPEGRIIPIMKQRTEDPTNTLHAGVYSDGFHFALVQALINAIPDGILVVDENNRIAAINNRFFELWDIDPDDFKGSHNNSVVGLSDETLLAEALQRVRDPEAFQARVQELYTNLDTADHSHIELKNGTVLERHSTTLRDDNFGYLGRVWFFSDITELASATTRLRDLALTDSLTQLANRRHFNMRLEEEFARARRYQQPLSIVMLDIDHFKQINDQYGHSAGDQALRILADSCRVTLRETDFLARTGGEEFIILMPNTMLEEAATSAERLRQHIATKSVPADTGIFQITVSLGITSLNPEDSSPEKLLKRVDEALYHAKGAGRNRVHKL